MVLPIGQPSLGQERLPHVLDERAVLHHPAGLVRKHQQPLFGIEPIVTLFQRFFEPFFSLPDVCRPGIVRPICEPHCNVAAVQLAGDLDAVNRVLQRVLADFGIGIAKRSVFVDLILEQIGINGTCLYTIFRLKCGNRLGGIDTFRTIP